MRMVDGQIDDQVDFIIFQNSFEGGIHLATKSGNKVLSMFERARGGSQQSKMRIRLQCFSIGFGDITTANDRKVEGLLIHFCSPFLVSFSDFSLLCRTNYSRLLPE